MKISDALALRCKEMKNAWNNRRCFDRSLVARIFRISRNRWFHSRCPGGRPDFTFAAFRDRQISKRVVAAEDYAHTLCNRTGCAVFESLLLMPNDGSESSVSHDC
jgi:hypothetical protein